MVTLSDIQHDTLVELFNIGVGRAAAAMSSMVSEEIALSVPEIHFLNIHDAAVALSGGNPENICGITQHFSGAFNTDVILMFPEDKGPSIFGVLGAMNDEDIADHNDNVPPGEEIPPKHPTSNR